MGQLLQRRRPQSELIEVLQSRDMDNAQNTPNLIRVKLTKQPHTGFGFTVRKGDGTEEVVVSRVTRGGMAERSGLVRRGDTVVMVNQHSVASLTTEQTIAMMDAVPTGSIIDLLLRGPPACATYLKTTFTSDGRSKWVRVTEPLNKPGDASNMSPAIRARHEEMMRNGVGEPHLSRESSPGGSPIIVLNSEHAASVDGHNVVNGIEISQEQQQIDNSSTSNVDQNQENMTNILVRDSKKGIQIWQKDDEITVIVKGDIQVNNGKEKKSESSPNSPALTKKPSQAIDLPQRSAESRPQSPVVKYMTIRNHADNHTAADSMHSKVTEKTECNEHRCTGSVMALPTPTLRNKEEVIKQSTDFINQYYSSIKRFGSASHEQRLKEVLESIEADGLYDLTTNELTYGARQGWRNAARCIGRIQWSKLQVFDARHIRSASGMFEAICNHIRYATNNGFLRSAITVFPVRTSEKTAYRIWNSQFFMYAGYKQADGRIIGDPVNVEFTEVCKSMGWRPRNGMFDILPLVLSANGQDPEMFEIPGDLILEVPLSHPDYQWLADMGLRWYALPAVSGMLFDCGGLQFTAAPFSGWYMETEIGARDLLDVQRYNLLEPIANQMGLDTSSNINLWKDKVAVEMNVAVLHSFRKAGVTIVDHHSTSDSFIKHMDNEVSKRGGCPGDWVWIVPPISGSITKVFHQEMLNYRVKPSYEYQEAAWKVHTWKTEAPTAGRPRRKLSFKQLASAVQFSSKLMSKALARRCKCLILYATETGKSESYSRTLCEIFKYAFDCRVVCMEDYDVADLEHETLVIIVTSTFGNGDPPDNGQEFARALFELNTSQKASQQDEFRKPASLSSSLQTTFTLHHSSDVPPTKPKREMPLSYVRQSIASRPITPMKLDSRDNLIKDMLTSEGELLSNVRYSVFALGSTAYPNFCAFGHYMDKMMYDLGGDRIWDLVEGDELNNEEESFRTWARDVFKAACDTFCVADAHIVQEATSALSDTDMSWSPNKFRIVTLENEEELDIYKGLGLLHKKKVYPLTLKSKMNLQAPHSSRQTLLLKFDNLNSTDLRYQPGDHLGLYPSNSQTNVDFIVSRILDPPPMDQLIKLEVLTETTTIFGTKHTWETSKRFPPFTLQRALTNYLDLCTAPSPMLLQLLAMQATNPDEQERMNNLAKMPDSYNEWKLKKAPSLMSVLQEFPSILIPPTLLLTQLPLLQQRYYSISSSPDLYSDEIHTTVSLLQYTIPDEPSVSLYGVCSAWLKSSKMGATVPGFIRNAKNFRMPQDATLPIVMVAAGCGIAPLRSFWQQREHDMDSLPPPMRAGRRGWGDMTLFFGCRRHDTDHIYKDEIAELVKKGIITEMNLALSRDELMPKTYVQHLLLQNGPYVYKSLFKRGGHFYVCGDVSMAAEVSSALEQIVEEVGQCNWEASRLSVIKLREDNRFHEDIFGVGPKNSKSNIQTLARRAIKHYNNTTPEQDRSTTPENQIRRLSCTSDN